MTLVVENATTHTYVDTFLGITMDFPKDWTFSVHSSPDDNISSFRSPCQTLAPDIFPPCAKIQISPLTEHYPNLEDLKKHIEAESPFYPLVSQQIEEIEMAKLPALRVKSKYDAGGEQHEILTFYILRETDIILINGYGALDPVDEIVGTIRSLEEK